jgi:hypothetical protein
MLTSQAQHYYKSVLRIAMTVCDKTKNVIFDIG